MTNEEREKRRAEYRKDALDAITKLTGVTPPYGEPWNTIADLQASAALLFDDRLERLEKLLSPVTVDSALLDDLKAFQNARHDYVPPMTDAEAATIRDAIGFIQAYRATPVCRFDRYPKAESTIVALAQLLQKHGHKG